MSSSGKPGSVRLDAAVDGILASYTTVGGINQIEGKNLPSLSRVVDSLHLLEGILFPGFYGQAPLGRRNLRYLIGECCVRHTDCLGEACTRSLGKGGRRGNPAEVWRGGEEEREYGRLAGRTLSRE